MYSAIVYLVGNVLTGKDANIHSTCGKRICVVYYSAACSNKYQILLC